METTKCAANTAKNVMPADEINRKHLDDEQRVKVLSPGMLVFKRFIRNKLAIVGTVIIIAMFLFAFLGGALSPYGESEVFMGYEPISKEYASVTVNKDFRYSVFEGMDFPAAAKAELILAINNGAKEFTAQKLNFAIIEEGERFYRIAVLDKLATASAFRGDFMVSALDGKEISKELTEAFKKAITDKQSEITVDGVTYSVASSGKEYSLGILTDAAVASTKVFDVYEEGTKLSTVFRYEAEKALNAGAAAFTADGISYQLVAEDGSATVLTKDGKEFASISNFVVQPLGATTFIPVDFKQQLEEAINNGEESLSVMNGEEETVYKITRKDQQFTVRAEIETQLIKIYEAPSKSHWLGTDANGMDILTRIMYGGRISLIIGFIVVFIEVLIGIVLGGIAGYFGSWVDNLIMRIVDIFYCIPSLPLIIIIGSIMDQMRLDPQIRIYFLMLLMGFLGWPGIARMVRGQILSLREQEFMTATEAMGISVSRRIFKHLIPNVIPQLIVLATMGLGSIILTESTLSFLGLGVKFPYASWGNIISAVNQTHVMTNYWFVWIPAGVCILLTVLAFNFIGDGLRDAFDPKMKR